MTSVLSGELRTNRSFWSVTIPTESVSPATPMSSVSAACSWVSTSLPGNWYCRFSSAPRCESRTRSISSTDWPAVLPPESKRRKVPGSFDMAH